MESCARKAVHGKLCMEIFKVKALHGKLCMESCSSNAVQESCSWKAVVESCAWKDACGKIILDSYVHGTIYVQFVYLYMISCTLTIVIGAQILSYSLKVVCSGP